MKKIFNLLLIVAFASGLNAQQSIAPHSQELKKSTADETLVPAQVTNHAAPASVAYTITDFPFTEGFEATSTPAYWTNERVIYNGDWKFSAGTGYTSTYNPIQTAHTGERNANFRPSSRGCITKLITPEMNINSLDKPVLSFWHAQPVWSGDQDTLRVYYRNSAGGKWELLVEHTNSITDWIADTIPLPNKSGRYYIAFEGIFNLGYGIGLDDVKIENIEDYVYDIDAAVTEIVAPVNNATNVGIENFTATETVTVKIKNNGTEDISGIPVTLELDGVIIVTDTIEGPITSSETIEYTFTETVDMSSTSKDYKLKVYTTLPKDIYTTNDTISVELLTLPEIKYTWDFEEGIPIEFQLINSDNAEIHNDLINIFKSNNAWMIITDEEPSQVATNNSNNNNSNSTNTYAASASYFASAGIQADRWMILPIITLGDRIILEWDASSADEGDLADGYKVVLSNTNDDISSFDEILFSTDKEETTWQNHLKKLSDYAGETVYIAFVQNSNNKRYIKIDNINIRGEAEISTSIKSIENTGIKIYPNPVTDNITIENGSGAEARIFDISGKLLINTKIKSNTELIDLNRLTTGIYFINVQNKDIKTSGKFIKK